MKFLVLKGLNVLHRGASYLPAIGSFRPVRGRFSALELVRQGRLEGQIIAEKQSIGKCPHGSMTEMSNNQQHDHQPWPIFWARSDQATLAGRLQLWRDDENRLCSEAVYNHPDRLRLCEDRWSAQLIVKKPERLLGAWTSLASKWNDGRNYFHWILDGLTRLMVRECLPEQTRILIPSSSPDFVAETLHLLGLANQVFQSESCVLSPERYYFCAPTAMTGALNPLGFNWIRKNFSSHFRPPCTGRPIFLTRRAGTRVPKRLTTIEALFTQAGFDIIDCGNLTALQQIQAASSARAIAGIHGAAMTNIIWASKGVPILEVFQPSYLNACYEQIAFQGQLDYSFVVMEPSQNLKPIEAWIEGLNMR